MKTKLKKLKDLVNGGSVTINSGKRLKAEAVKWRNRYAEIEDLENVVDWIDMFFNITMKDVKDSEVKE